MSCPIAAAMFNLLTLRDWPRPAFSQAVKKLPLIGGDEGTGRLAPARCSKGGVILEHGFDLLGVRYLQE